MIDFVMPDVGEAVVKACLVQWLKRPRDHPIKDGKQVGAQRATRERVIAPLTRHLSIGFDLEILMSPDRKGGGGATQT